MGSIAEGSALQNAASIAGLMLTTEAMVCEIPEKKPAAAPHPGGPEGMDYWSFGSVGKQSRGSREGIAAFDFYGYDRELDAKPIIAAVARAGRSGHNH